MRNYTQTHEKKAWESEAFPPVHQHFVTLNKRNDDVFSGEIYHFFKPLLTEGLFYAPIPLSTPAPCLPVQASVVYGFSQVLRLDLFSAFQISNGAR
jgi:hypothetical protein